MINIQKTTINLEITMIIIKKIATNPTLEATMININLHLEVMIDTTINQTTDITQDITLGKDHQNQNIDKILDKIAEEDI